ncbi:MAG TPA: hypothetical protein VLE93_00670 [Candidatus Saccharimonadales bacterium]|nr:hypothetical protein [Candidatus Saccharimonadales bacterium]
MRDDRAEMPQPEVTGPEPTVSTDAVALEAPPLAPLVEAPQPTETVATTPPPVSQPARRLNTREKFEQELETVRAALPDRLATSEAEVKFLKERLAEAPNSEAKAIVQKEIDSAKEKQASVFRDYAGDILHRAERGEKITENEWLIVAQDYSANAEKSAGAEFFLKRQGFETFEKGMRKVGLTTARGEALTVQLEKSKAPSWLKEHINKAGWSAATYALASCFLPVSALAFASSIGGGIIGRLGGEWLRGHELSKVRGEGDNKYRLNEKIMNDALSQIFLMKTEAEKALAAAKNPNERAQALGNLLSKIGTAEIKDIATYQKVEKTAAKWKAIGGFLGSVGVGSLVNHFFVTGHQLAAEVAKAKAEGIHIFHDAAGAHITADPTQGHVVKESLDGFWRAVVNKKDLGDLATSVSQHSAGVNNYFHAYLGDHVGLVSQQARYGQEMVHALVRDLPANLARPEAAQAATDSFLGASVNSAINELVRQTFIKSTLVMVGAAAVSESAFLRSDTAKVSAERLRAENLPLINELEAEALFQRQKVKPEKEPKPKNERERLEKLARKLHVELPESPHGFEEGWYKQPHLLQDRFTLAKLPRWPLIGSDGKNIVENGQEKRDGVAEVDVDNNKIVVVSKRLDGSYDHHTMKIDDFLRTHGKPKIATPSQAAPTESRPPQEQPRRPGVAERLDQLQFDNNDIMNAVLEEVRHGTPLAEDIKNAPTSAALSQGLYRIVRTLAEGWDGLDEATRRGNATFKFEAIREGDRNVTAITLYNPDNTKAILRLKRAGDGYRITLEDADGALLGVRNERPITVGPVAAFLQELTERFQALDDIAPPAPPAPPVPAPAPTPLPPAPAPVPTPPVPAPRPPDVEPDEQNEEEIFSQADFDEHDAIQPMAEIPPAIWSFITRSLPDPIDPESGLIRYRNADVANEKITLINAAGREQEFRLPFIQGIIDQLETTEDEES